MLLKVCGIRSLEDLRAIDGLSIDFLGINLSPSSKRTVSFDSARQLLSRISEFSDARPVLLFYKQSPKEVSQVLENLGDLKLDYFVQVYSFELFQFFKNQSKKIFFSVYEPDVLASRNEQADYLIFEASKPGAGLYEERVLPCPLPGFLAGGLNPNNVKLAIQKYRPIGVDIASGTEDVSGKKSREMIEQIIKEIK